MEWLAEVTRRGWVVLSKDFNIASNALERITLFECGARAFLLSQQDLDGPAQVRAFLGALRRIRNIAKSEPPPFIARVLPSGKVSADRAQTCLEACSARGTTNRELAPCVNKPTPIF